MTSRLGPRKEIQGWWHSRAVKNGEAWGTSQIGEELEERK